MKEKQNRMKTELQQKRSEIDNAKTKMKSKQNQEQVILGEVDNAQQGLLMISKTIIDLQSDLREQKKLQDEATRQKTRHETEINTLKSKLERYETDIERLESDRRRLDRDLQNKHRSLSEKQNEKDRFDYDLKRQQEDMNSKTLERQHHELTKDQIIGNLRENERKSKEIDKTIKKLEKEIETKNNEKQAAEHKVNESQREVNNTKRDIENLEKNATAKKQEYEKSRSKQTKYQTELDTLQDKKNDIDHRMSETQRNLNARILNVQQLGVKIGKKENDIRKNQQHKQQVNDQRINATVRQDEQLDEINEQEIHSNRRTTRRTRINDEDEDTQPQYRVNRLIHITLGSECHTFAHKSEMEGRRHLSDILH